MEQLRWHYQGESREIGIYVGDGVLEGDLFASHLAKKRVVWVSDPILEELYVRKLRERLGGESLAIPSGEEAKSECVVQDVVGKLFAMGALRDALLIAVGGGATSDLVGFVASIYMRGVAWLAVPTTLLGMADASIGGKTGIDTLFGKNLLGTLYPPRAVFADLSLLKSLSERTWNQGLFEILKLGLVFDLSIWEMAVRSSKDPSLIASAIAGKIAIVERDPHESGLRRILNFGHTIGHGLEWLSRYTLPHGEAVALGSIAEAHLSRALGYLSQEEFQRVEAGYRPFSLHWPQQVSLSALWEALLFDKKGSQGQVRFTVIDRIGHALEFQGDYCRPLLPEELKETLIWMERHWS